MTRVALMLVPSVAILALPSVAILVPPSVAILALAQGFGNEPWPEAEAVGVC